MAKREGRAEKRANEEAPAVLPNSVTLLRTIEARQGEFNAVAFHPQSEMLAGAAYSEVLAAAAARACAGRLPERTRILYNRV